MQISYAKITPETFICQISQAMKDQPLRRKWETIHLLQLCQTSVDGSYGEAL